MKCIKNYSDLQRDNYYLLFFPKIEDGDKACLFIFKYKGCCEVDVQSVPTTRHNADITYVRGKDSDIFKELGKNDKLIHDNPFRGHYDETYALMSEVFIYEFEAFEVMAEII